MAMRLQTRERAISFDESTEQAVVATREEAYQLFATLSGSWRDVQVILDGTTVSSKLMRRAVGVARSAPVWIPRAPIMKSFEAVFESRRLPLNAERVEWAVRGVGMGVAFPVEILRVEPERLSLVESRLLALARLLLVPHAMFVIQDQNVGLRGVRELRYIDEAMRAVRSSGVPTLHIAESWAGLPLDLAPTNKMLPDLIPLLTPNEVTQ